MYGGRGLLQRPRPPPRRVEDLRNIITCRHRDRAATRWSTSATSRMNSGAQPPNPLRHARRDGRRTGGSSAQKTDRMQRWEGHVPTLKVVTGKVTRRIRRSLLSGSTAYRRASVDAIHLAFTADREVPHRSTSGTSLGTSAVRLSRERWQVVERIPPTRSSTSAASAAAHITDALNTNEAAQVDDRSSVVCPSTKTQYSNSN